MTLTYILDLDILSIQVRMFVRFALIVVTDRHTHRQTDKQCQNYYTLHVRDVGCKNVNKISCQRHY